MQVRPEVFGLLHDRFVPMLIEEGVSRVNGYRFMTDQNSEVLDTLDFWNDMEQQITLPVALPTSAPVLGQRLEASVDLTTTGRQSAFVVFSPTSPAIPLPTGSALFSSAGGEFLPLESGPVARWSLAIPGDATLAGLEITLQAIHVGNQQTVILSNPIDLRFGR